MDKIGITKDFIDELEKTLKESDERCGNVDEESHRKLEELKNVFENMNMPQSEAISALNHEESISHEINRLNMKLDDFERKLSNADNKTKEYLKMAAEAIMKEEKD